ncbi:MAG: hypothetical protein R3321_01625 [Nitrososphaeraceae archaeon]|nr:hypothetical protein [Nitrososphaeraceae archaeon]
MKVNRLVIISISIFTIAFFIHFITSIAYIIIHSNDKNLIKTRIHLLDNTTLAPIAIAVSRDNEASILVIGKLVNKFLFDNISAPTLLDNGGCYVYYREPSYTIVVTKRNNLFIWIAYDQTVLKSTAKHKAKAQLKVLLNDR